MVCPIFKKRVISPQPLTMDPNAKCNIAPSLPPEDQSFVSVRFPQVATDFSHCSTGNPHNLR